MGKREWFALSSLVVFVISRVTGSDAWGGLWVLCVLFLTAWNIDLLLRDRRRRRRARRIAEYVYFTDEQLETIRAAVGSRDVSELDVAQEMVLREIEKSDPT